MAVLKDLLTKIEYECVCGTLDKEVTDIVYDSRNVSVGSMFVCIPGAVVDGHKIGSGGLPFGTCDADDLHLLRGITIESCGHKRHGIMGILHPDHCYPGIFRQFHLLFHKKSPCTGRHSRCGELMQMRQIGVWSDMAGFKELFARVE